MPDYETFAHEADIGIRGFGATMEEAFSNAAKAMYSVMVALDRVEPREARDVKAAAGEREALLIEWLNGLLAVSDIDRMVFSRFQVRFEGNTLSGRAWGERLDPLRHEPKVEVKGATYHQLSVREEQGAVVAQCVVDV